MATQTIKERVDEMLTIPSSHGEDTTDGSPYQMLATMFAIETIEENQAGSTMLQNAFISTATESFLSQHGINMGLLQIEATKSTGIVDITGTAGRVIADGSKCFRSADNVSYTIIKGGTIGTVALEVNVIADVSGTEGNATIGTIDRLEDMTGITLVNNINNITNATNQEDTETYRKRLLKWVQRPHRSGNSADYEYWAEEIDDIARAKCFPAWNGGGTVKVVAINQDYLPITEEKRIEIQNYMLLKAPISAILTTVIPLSLKINIEIKAKLNNGWGKTTAQRDIITILTAYIQNKIAFLKDDIFYLDCASVIADAQSINSLITLNLNGATNNITIPIYIVPILGSVTITEEE